MLERTVLDNGIRVLTECQQETHAVSLGVWVGNGSRHEAASVNGISHFVEHMFFKGTNRRSAHSIALEIDSVGGVLNGFTSRELSCYYVKVLAEKLPLAIDLLGDLLCHSLFDLDEIEKERQVILQEIAMVEDNPEEYIHEMFIQGFWAGHPLGRPIIGTSQTIGEIDRSQMLSFLKDRYFGENLIVVAAGNLDHAEVVKLVDETFAEMPRHGAPAQNRQPLTVRQIQVTTRALEQTHICLGVEALPHDHQGRYVAYLLNNILGGNMSSRLFQHVREDLGLAYSIYSYLSAHSDSGALVMAAGTKAENAPLAVRTMLHELNVLRQEPVSADELRSAKDNLKGSLLLSMESSDNRMTRLAQNELFLGRSVSLEESQSAIEEVTRDQIQNLAQQLFNDRTLNLQVVGQVSMEHFPHVDLCLN